MKVFLDDVRPMPEGFDILVKTAEEAIELVETGKVTVLSLDHDLGESRKTGYDVAKYIEEKAALSQIGRIEILVHSANPVGVENMLAAIRKANQYWSLTEMAKQDQELGESKKLV